MLQVVANLYEFLSYAKHKDILKNDLEQLNSCLEPLTSKKKK